ncbi:MAG: type 4 pilus major pilin [Alphaproteobacteria bacterium]|nr:type 4 pilus major pilin [Alphaproteobacteria bacterium]
MRVCIDSRRGFTLTEAAIVLGVAGIILGAIWAGAGAVYTHMKIGDAQKYYLQIAQNVRSARGMRTTFSDSSVHSITTQMITAGAIPPELVTSPTYAAHMWGGPIRVFVINATTFRVSFYSVPRSACTSLVTAIATGDKDTARAVILDSGGIVVPVSGPVDVGTAAGDTLCGGAIDPTSVEFDFSLS